MLFRSTAGRTTLAGEGLQHDDGHSQLIAHLHPHVAAYDPSFAYELVFANRLSALGSPIAAVDLRIEERIGVVGDSIHQIDAGSTFAQQLARLDPGSTWLAFAVDAWSLDVFRAARAFAVERGFVTRWEPATIDFPVTHVMAEGGAEVLLTPQTMRFKPQR